jgi:surface polysaccharide O-acyltransferase-like enzyme
MGKYSSFAAYVKYLGTADGVQSIIAHLWFVQHLLIYSVLFAVVMWIVRKIRPRSQEIAAREKLSSIALYSVAAAVLVCVALLSYAVRMSYPIDRWLVILNCVRIEPAHVPQYAVFFLAGAVAGQTGMLDRIRSIDGKVFCVAGVAAVMIRILCGSFFGQLSPEMLRLVYAFIETLIAVTVSIGLIVLFRDVMNRSTPVLRFFSDNAYGVYLYHVFPMVGLQMAIAGSHVGGEIKFIGAAIVSLAASYMAVYLVRKIKAVRRCV